MNSLNLKFEPKKKVDLSSRNSRSVLLGTVLALLALVGIYMNAYYESEEYADKIQHIQKEYNELNDLINRPGYSVSLNDSILTVKNSQYDLSIITNDVYDNAQEVSQVKYYYTKINDRIYFKVEVVIKVDALSDGYKFKQDILALSWATRIEEVSYEVSGQKSALKYGIFLNMEALKYEKN